MLVAGLNAKSDNSLSNLLGMGNFDMWLNLEQWDTPVNGKAGEEKSNGIAGEENSNDIMENKITYTRHSADDWSDEDSYDDSEDDCPTCFEDIGEGLVHEYGDPGHRHHSRGHADDIWGNRGNSKQFRKHGMGESIMSDDPINTRDGHGGRSTIDGIEDRGSRNFDFHRSPTTRHYETKGHHFSREYEDEVEKDEYLPKPQPKKKTRSHGQARDEIEEKELKQKSQPEPQLKPTLPKPETAHRHHHHHRNHEKNELEIDVPRNPYERHRAYQDTFLVMHQTEEEQYALSEHETSQLDFYLENGLLLLAEQIA